MALFEEALARRRRTRRGTLASLPQLQQTVLELEQEVDEFGAAPIAQDSPGFLSRTIEVLSGFEFALAGALDEFSQGNGLGAMVGRATSELYESARSLPFGQILPEIGTPERETFSQVFKQMGIPTTTLADVFPAMEGTFLGELINTRGTAALATSVITDPLTYATFGLSAVARRTLPRFAAQGVKKGVNKKGFKELTSIERTIREATPELADDAVEAAAAKQLLNASNAAELFDPGGFKIAGWVVPGTPGVGGEILNVVGAPIVAAANSFGLGRRVMQNADNYWDGAKAIIRETFSEFGPLELLPEGVREPARRMARKWTQARSQMNQRYGMRVENSRFVKYFRDNPERIEPVMDMLDGEIPRRFVDEIEEGAATDLAGLLEEIARSGVSGGLWDQAQVARPSYIFHRYLNDPEDMAEVWVGAKGTVPQVSGKHAKQREFATMKEGQRVSKALERVGKLARQKGIPAPIYRELIPDYDIEHGLARYIDWFSGQMAYRGMARDFRGVFGREIPSNAQTMRSIMEGSVDAITEAHPEYEAIKGFFGSYKSLAKMSEEAALFAGERATKDTRIVGWQAIVQDARGLLDGVGPRGAREVARKAALSPGGKRQFFHELFLRAKSPSQAADIMVDFADDIDFWPKQFSHADEIEDALRIFGEQSKYTQVGGNAIWGEGRDLIPRLIKEYVENADARIFNTKDFKGWRSGLRTWAHINNVFKTAVYPFFPSSAFRDKISNMFLSGIRIGWNAINPRTRSHTWASLTNSQGIRSKIQGVMGDGFTAVNGRRYTHAEVNQLMRDNNVLISGKQWAELTDDGVYRFANEKPLGEVVRAGDLREIARNVPQPLTGRGRARALEIRAAIDNEDRAHLFVQGLMDGLNPQEAAADVAEFLFNYNELGAIHRDFVRNIIPFSTFTIKNTRLQLKALRTKPGAVINQLKPFRGEHSENESMVKFEAEGLKLRIDGDGKTVRMLTGIDMPLRNLDTLWAGGVGETGRRFLGMMSPIIKIPIEGATGVDLFTGRDVSRAPAPMIGRFIDNTPTPKWFRDWVGYRKRVDDAGRPQYSLDGPKAQMLIKGFVFSRLVSVSDRQFREYLTGEEPSALRAMLDVATGLRAKDINLDDQRRAKLLRRVAQLEESLARRGRRAKFTKRFEPKNAGEF